jgi:hypothetical protein
MRAYLVIAALAALAVLVIAHEATTPDPTFGALACTAGCSGHAADIDNGIGVGPPINPDDVDDGDN